MYHLVDGEVVDDGKPVKEHDYSSKEDIVDIPFSLAIGETFYLKGKTMEVTKQVNNEYFIFRVRKPHER